MIRKEEVYRIGVLNKPHGVRGEVLFTFTDDIFDRVDCDYIVCLMDGIFVPFYVEEYRFRTDTTALLKLEDIDTAEQARRFTNVEVYFPVKYVDELDPSDRYRSWDYFKGFVVEDVALGHLGQIVEVENSTVNTLFVVEREGRELLIPAQEEFIRQLDEAHKKMLVCLPDGLVNLNELPAVED
ncbi:MAG: ribosome maturation factor RimM [Bacteroidaceae bacterium]